MPHFIAMPPLTTKSSPIEKLNFDIADIIAFYTALPRYGDKDVEETPFQDTTSFANRHAVISEIFRAEKGIHSLAKVNVFWQNASQRYLPRSITIYSRHHQTWNMEYKSLNSTLPLFTRSPFYPQRFYTVPLKETTHVLQTTTPHIQHLTTLRIHVTSNICTKTLE